MREEESLGGHWLRSWTEERSERLTVSRIVTFSVWRLHPALSATANEFNLQCDYWKKRCGESVLNHLPCTIGPSPSYLCAFWSLLLRPHQRKGGFKSATLASWLTLLTTIMFSRPWNADWAIQHDPKIMIGLSIAARLVQIHWIFPHLTYYFCVRSILIALGQSWVRHR